MKGVASTIAARELTFDLAHAQGDPRADEWRGCPQGRTQAALISFIHR